MNRLMSGGTNIALSKTIFFNFLGFLLFVKVFFFFEILTFDEVGNSPTLNCFDFFYF